jgi:hypothetical protein
MITGETRSQLEGRLEAARVVITVDPLLPGAIEVAHGLVGLQRRLPGQIAIDPAGLDSATIDAVIEVGALIDPDRLVSVRRPTADDITVAIASVAPDGVLHAVPDLHGARLARVGSLRQSRVPSGLGVHSTAAAIAGEVFKAAARVRGPRARQPDRWSFCPVLLSDDPGQGPTLPPVWRLDGMLLGLGAIGTATAKILAAMPVEGQLDLVDPQRFAPENVGTYALGGVRDAVEQPNKTELVATALRSFATRQHQAYAADLPALVDQGRLAWPRYLLTGLDSPAARRDAQRLWPDVLVDGGTGDTMVGLHVAHEAGCPCMACFFPERSVPVRPVAADLAAVTTLPRELLVQGQRLLGEEDLLFADEDRRAELRQHVGKPICGLASAYGLTDLPDEGYRPAVPFVAMAAAVLVVGRLVAIATGAEPAANFVQYDALVGPDQRTADRRHGRPGCDCDRHRAIVERVRAMRSTHAERR